MSIHEAKVIRLPEIRKHPDADKLGLVSVWGYTVIVALDSWKEGDLAAYLEPDTLVPLNRPEFAFLKHYEDRTQERIKVKKLRGIYSQGLLVPMREELFKEGDDAWEFLGLERYVPRISSPGTSLGSAPSEAGPSGIVAPKYDLENYRKFARLLVEGEEIIITEKLHGCLNYETKVTLFDGTKKKIGQIVNQNLIGLEVMGLRKDGKIIPTKITNVFNNGKELSWLEVKGTRKGYSGGNKFFSIVCTKNHKFKTSNGWKRAEELKKNDVVFSYRKTQKLTPAQFQSCEILQEGLLKFDVKSILYKTEKGFRIRLNAEEAEKFFLLIIPYVPHIMQYKLPERYRGFTAWLPEKENEYKKELIEQEILSVKQIKKPPSGIKFDIETETHNFFANDILVHNSNARFVYAGDRMWCGTRTRWITSVPDKQNIWWKALETSPWLEKFCKEHPGWVLYGEVFGQVQDLKYGHEKGEVSIRIFDIWRDLGSGWSFEDASELIKHKDLELVPLLYTGPYSDDIVKKHTDGKTTIDMKGEHHIREGCVIKPSIERNNERIGRVALKNVSDKYLEKSK